MSVIILVTEKREQSKAGKAFTAHVRHYLNLDNIEDIEAGETQCFIRFRHRAGMWVEQSIDQILLQIPETKTNLT